jgi:hypothetical protein
MKSLAELYVTKMQSLRSTKTKRARNDSEQGSDLLTQATTGEDAAISTVIAHHESQFDNPQVGRSCIVIISVSC